MYKRLAELRHVTRNFDPGVMGRTLPVDRDRPLRLTLPLAIEISGLAQHTGFRRVPITKVYSRAARAGTPGAIVAAHCGRRSARLPTLCAVARDIGACHPGQLAAPQFPETPGT